MRLIWGKGKFVNSGLWLSTTMSDDEFIDAGMFEEPEGFLPPPPEAHYATYERSREIEPKEIKLRLVGKSPLWGHLLWNAGIFTANFLDKHWERYVKGKKVLELGAAASLPSLICAINQAAKVVSTDYPDPELLENIQINFNENKQFISKETKVKVKGYIWGNDVRPIVYEEIEDEDMLPTEIKEEDKFDLIILSDLIFNHTEHEKLLHACRQSIKRTGKGLIVFSPHRAHLLHEDLKFFTTCEDFDFKAEKIDMVTWKPMFEEDDETAEVRSRVYSYFINPQWT